MSIDPGQYHQLLVHQNREKIELAAVKAFEQRLEIPVVMVLDAADPAANAMARDSGLESQIDAWIAESDQRGLVRVLTWHLPARFAHRLLLMSFPGVEAFEPLAGDKAFHIVVVSRGAVSIVEAQLP